MALTESERHELNELTRHKMGDRLAELLMRSIPHDPDRFATKDDLARTEANLRADMAELRAEVIKTVSDAITGQTRTLLIGLIVAIVATNLAAALG